MKAKLSRALRQPADDASAPSPQAPIAGYRWTLESLELHLTLLHQLLNGPNAPLCLLPSWKDDCIDKRRFHRVQGTQEHFSSGQCCPVLRTQKCKFLIHLQIPFTKSKKKQTKASAIIQASAGHEIKLITSDVDGTLLDSQQRLTEKVQKAVRLSRSVGVPVSPCCIDCD